MASLNFCSDISLKLLLRLMAYCHITLTHLHQGGTPCLDLDRVELDKHLVPQDYKPVSKITRANTSKHELWQELHTDMPCRGRLGNINEKMADSGVTKRLALANWSSNLGIFFS